MLKSCLVELQKVYLAIVMPPQMRSATFDLKPHALHVMQVVGLVAVLGEHGSRLLCLLYLSCPELPLSCLTVHKPAVQSSWVSSNFQVHEEPDIAHVILACSV